MQRRPPSSVDTTKIKSPAFVIEEDILRHNLGVLLYVKEETGCTMYQALKTWATWPLFTVTKEYLDGTEVSSLNEARLGYEEFNHEVHIYAPAYKTEEFDDILKYCSTIIFNSFAQWKMFKPRVDEFIRKTGTVRECGLRINPEYRGRDEHGGLWSPCAPGSRLGIRASEFEAALKEDAKALDGISGLHFHIFWDKRFDELKEAVAGVEKNFGKYFAQMKWINFGGGQVITEDDYDVEGLIALINGFKKKHGVEVHMEPGAAIVKWAGELVTTVLDIVHRDDVPYKIAILDISFIAHMPDFLLAPEMDNPVRGARIVRDLDKIPEGYLYQLAGGTCVTGDKLSHYHLFKKPLTPGDTVIIEDGIQYNLVQCTMFNGVQHPSIVLWKENAPTVLRKFTYEDFKSRMG